MRFANKRIERIASSFTGNWELNHFFWIGVGVGNSHNWNAQSLRFGHGNVLFVQVDNKDR